MGNYKEWTSDNAPVTKAKPLIMSGVEADYNLHEQAKNMNAQPTPLQELSYLVKTEADRAQRAADAKKEAENERAAKRLKDNHTEEARMHLRDEVGDNHRVSIPTLSTTQPAVATAVQQLSRQPGSVGKCCVYIILYMYLISCLLTACTYHKCSYPHSYW